MSAVPYAHITQGPAVVRPFVPVVVPVRRSINPLVPLCCLGLILFLIAATIVLALIPVYLQSRGNRANLEVVPYHLLYRLNNGTLPVGATTPDNTNAIQQDQQNVAASNNGVSPSTPIVTQSSVTGNTSVTGRRRRQFQVPEGNLISVDGFLAGTNNCRQGSCLTRRAERFIALLLGRGVFFLTLAGANGTQYVFSVTIISASISPAQSVSGSGGAGGAGGAGGSGGSGSSSSASANNDLAIFNYALVLEQLEQYFYNHYQSNFTAQDFIAANFTQQTYDYFNLIASHENAHVNILTTVISQRGGTPVSPCTYNFASVTNVRSYVSVARILENTGTMAYDGAANGVADPTLREMAATIATVEARHAAYLNALNGLTPFPTPFENATVPSVVIQAITPFLVSCPFTLTPPTVPYIGSSSFNGSIPTTNNTAVSPYTSAMYVNDLRVLNFALITEQLEATFYNTYAANFTSNDYTSNNLSDATSYFVMIREIENTHANFVRDTITQRGGTPVPLCTYQFNVSNVLDFVRLSRLFENTGVSAYDGAINRISDPNLILGGAVIATVEARFASYLNRLTGNLPFPDVTDPTLSPTQVVAALSPYQTCPFIPELPDLLVS